MIDPQKLRAIFSHYWVTRKDGLKFKVEVPKEAVDQAVAALTDLLRQSEQQRNEALEALGEMWEQYCPLPYTHKFMSAGEGAEEVLEKYGLLNNGLFDHTAMTSLQAAQKGTQQSE